jgi:chromosomal replication initiator protein
MEIILEVVCDNLKVKQTDVLQRPHTPGAKQGYISRARQICMSFAYKYQLGSLREVGLFYGMRDHATVLHAIRTVQNDIDTSKEMKDICYVINSELSSIDDELKKQSLEPVYEFYESFSN